MLTLDRAAPDRIVLTGRLDAAQAASAQSVLDGVTGTVTLDCAALDYISSAGLGVLLKTQKRLQPAGGGLVLRGLNRHVRDVFTYSGFDQIFRIEPAA
jgi:anti-sigma B factor antagonist